MAFYTIVSVTLFFCMAAALNAVFVVVYNRYLSMMHESVIKKVVALAGLPTGTILSLVLTVIVMRGPDAGLLVWYAIPTMVFSLLGAVVITVVFLERVYQKRDDWWRGRSRVVEFSDPVDMSRLSWKSRFVLRFLQPFNDAGRLRIHEGDLKLDDLPASFEGYRILHMTDFHLHHTLRMEWFDFVIDQMLEQDADLILFGGDMISKYPHVDHVLPYLKKIRARVGVLYVRGNHDFWKAPHRLRRHAGSAGFTLLSNQSCAIKRPSLDDPDRMDELNILGFETPYVPLTEKERADLDSVPQPKLALVHTPEAYEEAAKFDPQLTFAGHTHGGQIRLPFFGTTICGCPVAMRFADGRSRMGDMKTWTSRGVGAFFPFRFRCAPEMIVLTLRCRKNVSG